MKKTNIVFGLIILLAAVSCNVPQPKKKGMSVKHNYIVLLDLSDRIIVQPEQVERDKEIVSALYSMFEDRVRKNLYVRSRDEIKVVMAPQRGSGLRTEGFEDKMYINMDKIPNVHRRAQEEERKAEFNQALEDLYKKAKFSKNPSDYYGADIWKYFYEDLETDLTHDSLSKNFLIILTDGYPIVGKDRSKLQNVKDSYEDLTVILIEASPREKDMEWDHIMDMWSEWFDSMNIKDYTFIKRKAITKEIEQVKEIVDSKD